MSAFKSFNDIVSWCYGTELHTEFQCKVAIFAKDYLKLGTTVTPIVHAAMVHLTDLCLMVNQGLGSWSD